MLPASQVLAQCREIIEAEVEVFNRGASVQVRNEVPDTFEIPIQDPRHWLRISGVICVYVDMKNSTTLSAATQDRGTAAAYQLFTGGAVRILNSFDPAYIDVRGDGAFALFDSGQEHRALVAAVTFKTFAHVIVVGKVKELTGHEIGCHVGVDQKTVLVRKIGLKRTGGRTDRQNEVWAGKPVNMAAKLASLSEHNEILVSDRFFQKLTHEWALMSCGCNSPFGSQSLWTRKDLAQDQRFDFSSAYSLRSNWCRIHGTEYADSLLRVR